MRGRSEEHTSELQSPDTISYAVFCLKKKKKSHKHAAALAERGAEVEERGVCGAVGDEGDDVGDRLCDVGRFYFFFFFNDTATTEIYTVSDTLSLHDALPICLLAPSFGSSVVLRIMA